MVSVIVPVFKAEKYINQCIEKIINQTYKDLEIIFHGLRHTYSNILFEANKNPKVIQALLGHKSVSTTIKTYNSVDKTYFKQAIDVLNSSFTSNKINERINLENKKFNIENMNNDELHNLLIELLEEREKRKKEI